MTLSAFLWVQRFIVQGSEVLGSEVLGSEVLGSGFSYETSLFNQSLI